MLNDRLAFLEDLIAPKKDRYLEAPFLKSTFGDNAWVIKLDDKTDYFIDFNIKISKDTYLTDHSNSKTLLTLKYWIIESIYDNNAYLCTGGTILRKVNAVLTIFDCMNLLNKNELVAKSGFSFISSDYFKHIFFKISEDNDKFENIYDVSGRLLEFYKIHHEKNNSFDNIEPEEIQSFVKTLKNNEIRVKDLFPDTLLKPSKWPDVLNEASSTRTYLTEYPGYFREKKKSTPLTSSTLNFYTNAIKVLQKLELKFINNTEFTFPSAEAFVGIDNFSVETQKEGRFETYPSTAIFSCFKSAVEFHFKYGDDIVNSFVEFINNVKNNYPNTETFSHDDEIKKIFLSSLTSKLNELGVKELKQERPDKQRFKHIRNNHYLFEILKVYYGAVQFVVGALMARRQSELGGLIANECIDEVNQVLLFKRSKSTKGLFGTRDTLALPVDPLVIEMIKNIEKIHTAIGGKNKVFALPLFKNPTRIKEDTSGNYYGQNLDAFMDYIEAPVIDGKRLYIRQHQLRRFFAMSFFWGSGFGSLDTLRWFMGHTDVQHLYYYITESTPGEVLRSVKAQYVAEDFKKYHDLAELIKEKYHTDNFDIIETDELTYYIESLMEDGFITVEPDFLKDDKNNQFEIVVKVIKKDIQNENR